MDFAEYQSCVESLPYGKRLPSAVYVYWDDDFDLPHGLRELVRKVFVICEAGPEYNIVKFRVDEPKLSLLSYPEFFSVPHPVLKKSVTANVTTWHLRRADYAANLNPPILHRKETFLPKDHPRYVEFEALTHAEEEAGLYEETATIGFKLNWERILAAKGVSIANHRVLRFEPKSEGKNGEGSGREIHRHKTALTRYDLSKPVKTALQYGFLSAGTSFFDYGCGQGADVEGLKALGVLADGWDPVHRPASPKAKADVVNLGYVINVIEDPAERLEALVDAFRYTKKLLIVSALIHETVNVSATATFADGVLTKRNTFQKFFEQQELQQFIEDALETTAVPVALGIFYVFCDPAAQQDFVSARTRRSINWAEISARIGLGTPAGKSGRTSLRERLYEEHKELFDAFWARLVELGRLPIESEFSRHDELCRVIGSGKRALRLFIDRGGQPELESAARSRRNDLLVYLAMAAFRKKVPFHHLSTSLRGDIKAFFGSYKRALDEGVSILFESGRAAAITNACSNLPLGWQDEQALFIHQSLLPFLPPLLRVYVGCATLLFGDVTTCHVIKLHKASGKVTFLIYDDFQGNELPELQRRIKVNLRTRAVDVFDHSGDHQTLDSKDRFLRIEPTSEAAQSSRV